MATTSYIADATNYSGLRPHSYLLSLNSILAS